MVKVKAALLVYHDRDGSCFSPSSFIKIQQAVYYFDPADPRPYVYDCGP